MRRFYLPDLPVDADQGTAVRLEGPEAHHVLNVVRVRDGEMVELFDGRGRSGPARKDGASRRHVDLTLTGPLLARRPARPLLTLAAASPKQDRLKWLIEKATELGVTRFVPLQTERTIVMPGTGKLERLDDVVIQACKQCGRNDLLRIESPVGWTEFLRQWGETAQAETGQHLFLAAPTGQRFGSILRNLPQDGSPHLTILIGPEGGLTVTEEAEAQEAGAVPMSLGRLILRIETAAVAAAAVVRAVFEGDHG